MSTVPRRSAGARGRTVVRFSGEGGDAVSGGSGGGGVVRWLGRHPCAAQLLKQARLYIVGPPQKHCSSIPKSVVMEQKMSSYFFDSCFDNNLRRLGQVQEEYRNLMFYHNIIGPNSS